MFARNVHMQLKPNTAAQFTQTLEKEVIPLLRKQQGFRDEIAFLGPNDNEAYTISFWDSKEKADAYNRAGYPEVLKTLAKVVEGTPQLQTYEVCTSTIQQISARA
jgi:heme-degrading monooxygenase HmoA